MLNINETALVVIDVQTKLAHLMHDHDVLYHNIERVIKVSQVLNLPILWTEQAPEKIGPTVEAIHDTLFPLIKPIAKRSFSCWGCEEFKTQLSLTKCRQVILVGIETHVCVYQTAADLKAHGFEVFVAADAVSSRSSLNSEVTLTRMRQEGMTVTVGEALICELIRGADHPKFRDVMGYIKK
ncbi:MAG: hydrolase [Candidatus Omnitrophica bacterium]|nr:hydrolase [Candidatus Omnitrophota bacterium]